MNVRIPALTGLWPVLVLLAGLAILTAVTAAPFIGLRTLKEEVAQGQSNLIKLGRAATSLAELRKEHDYLSSQSEDTTLLIGGETTGIAGANLQKLLNGIVTESRATAQSFQVLPVEEDGNLTRIPVNLSITADIDAMQTIVHRIETGTPLIFVDDIIVRPSFEAGREAGPNFIGPFDVTLQVSGYSLKKGS